MENILEEKLQLVKLLILDVDGVLTDGKLYYTPNGDVLVNFHVHDGLGITRLIQTGIKVALISGRHNQALTYRAATLGIQYVFQGHRDKCQPFEALLSTLNLKENQVAYVGDDLADLPLMKRVGVAIAVPNAVPAVRKIADWITFQAGGHGAVREVCDRLLTILPQQQK